MGPKKTAKTLMHAKILQTPASITCKKTARSSYLHFLRHEQLDDLKSPASFLIHIFFLVQTQITR